MQIVVVSVSVSVSSGKSCLRATISPAANLVYLPPDRWRRNGDVFVSGDNMPPAGMTSLLAGPAWCPCSWFCGTEEVLCQAFTCPWVGFSPRLPLLQRSGDHDDRKTQRRQYSPRLQKGARGAVRTPSSQWPYNGRSLPAPCYASWDGLVASKNSHYEDVSPRGTRSFFVLPDW